MDDAAHESVAIVPTYNLSSLQILRILERIGTGRDLPKIIRTAYGKHF